MRLPVVEATGVCLALVHSAVDAGLGSSRGTFDQEEERLENHPLPQS